MDDLDSIDDKITLEGAKDLNLHIDLKREDLLHPEISGNKWRKLRFNIKETKARGLNKVLTFGGAYSNHLAATAMAGKINGIQTVGVVRGEAHPDLNPTLIKAKEDGMILYHVSRSEYREKDSREFLDFLKNKFGDFMLIPEGGANKLGVKGCMEILKPGNNYDYIVCAAGTGATCAGILLSLQPEQRLLCFSALKGGEFLKRDITNYLGWFVNEDEVKQRIDQLDLQTDYHFGGFGKVTADLINFMRRFFVENNIKLDPLYTSKMLYGLERLIKNSYFKANNKVLAIHTGGLQGIKGMEERMGFSIY